MKQNRVVIGILFVLILAIITACGGGGASTTGTTATTATTGTTTTTATTSTTATTGQTIIGPVSGLRIEAKIEGSATTVDPTNIFVNEIVRFRLTGIDEGTVGQPRVVLPAGAWSMTGTPGGSLQSNGVFSAASSPSGLFGTVKTSYNGLNYTFPVRVVIPEAIIAGLGRTTTGFAAGKVGIQALNASGTVVATGLVASDGTIRMSLPTTAVKFTADFSLADPGPTFYYARQFAYDGLDYATTVSGCTAPLPALTLGSSTNLASAVVFYANSNTSPPPPPDGCS